MLAEEGKTTLKNCTLAIKKYFKLWRSSLWFHESGVLCLEFFPAPVSEAEGDRHPWGGSDIGNVRKGCRILAFASIFLILTPPLPCLLLPDLKGGSQSLPQELTDLAGLLLSIFNRWHTRSPPIESRQTHHLQIVCKDIKLLIKCVCCIPHLTQAFSTVEEMWCSHTNTLVQLLQQDATHSLHLIKIRESDLDLWEQNTCRVSDSLSNIWIISVYLNTPPLLPCDTVLPPGGETSSLRCLFHWHHVV